MKRKLTLTVAIVLILSTFFSMSALAVVITPNGYNTTFATAQEIQRNQTTPESRLAIDLSKEQVVVGTLPTLGAEHWYKVYLPANPLTVLSVNTYSATVDVYDASLNTLYSGFFVKDFVEGIAAVYVEILTAGWYYIKVYSGLGEYRMTIGNPNYNLDTLTFPASTLTLGPGITSAETSIDLTSTAGLPRDAIVYQVLLEGTRSGTVSNEKRSVKYANETNFMQGNIVFTVAVPTLQNKMLANNWTIKWEGTASATRTLAPAVRFRVIYPVLPPV